MWLLPYQSCNRAQRARGEKSYGSFVRLHIVRVVYSRVGGFPESITFGLRASRGRTGNRKAERRMLERHLLCMTRHHFLIVWSFPTPHISLSIPTRSPYIPPCLLQHVILALTCIYSSRSKAGQTSRFIPLTRVQVIFISEGLRVEGTRMSMELI